MKRRRIAIGVAAVVALLASLTACGDKVTEPFKDAPRSSTTNREAADIIEMPDGFSNLSTKCDHGNRVYVVYKGDDNRAALAVVSQDPTCNH
ncbi:putative small lipoprotein YifL [Actinomadura coerulea]|uniref:Putative small lipoprotein YifL n=1 Tax=Actinomadura coerulea TaxID=46159 RepID=A0A7X0G6Y9_9ACTN|nr:hypothetical protein [Actinomadura coerulea]MBB6399700.1 putative small lipoprotein YifL [Actinomadura coerulea]GGQ11847.1 hypothetical protein GCM10010187_29980 [Actinomadura coerulea]